MCSGFSPSLRCFFPLFPMGLFIISVAHSSTSLPVHDPLNELGWLLTESFCLHSGHRSILTWTWWQAVHREMIQSGWYRFEGKWWKKTLINPNSCDPLSNFWWIKKLERNINGFSVWISVFALFRHEAVHTLFPPHLSNQQTNFISVCVLFDGINYWKCWCTFHRAQMSYSNPHLSLARPLVEIPDKTFMPFQGKFANLWLRKFCLRLHFGS